MISQPRLEAIVAEWNAKGFNASQIAKKTGVPVQRVQAALHKVRGADPAAAAKRTAKGRRQKDKKLFGDAYIGPQAARSLRRAR
jgi:hypothetical protein